ncbi:hypothetical protein HRbin11_01152 [bacterium HR11]|nr:hypothetical protein HRbin11_01152 [bacterium HR11]
MGPHLRRQAGKMQTSEVLTAYHFWGRPRAPGRLRWEDGGETHGPHDTIPQGEVAAPRRRPRPWGWRPRLWGPGPVVSSGWGFNSAVPGIGSTGSGGTLGSRPNAFGSWARAALDRTEGHHDLKMRVASGDPGPGGGLLELKPSSASSPRNPRSRLLCAWPLACRVRLGVRFIRPHLPWPPTPCLGMGAVRRGRLMEVINAQAR